MKELKVDICYVILLEFNNNKTLQKHLRKILVLMAKISLLTANSKLVLSVFFWRYIIGR